MDRAPAGVGRPYDWEVEHVYDLAVEEVPVARAPGYQLGDSSSTGAEDLAVEEAVDDVAEASSDNQR